MDADDGSATLRGLAAAVQPTFMLPAVGLSATGAVLAPTVDSSLAATHAVAVGLALYTAHLVDEYVDGHLRGEEDPTLPAWATTYAGVASTTGFFAAVAWLWVEGPRAAAALTVPLWVLAVLHAPLLDKHPLTVTADYPFGVGLAFVGGYLAQAGALDGAVLVVAGLLVVSLSARKVSIDRLDRDFDRTIDKRTLPVLLGDRRSALVAAGVHVTVASLTGAAVAVAVLPDLALVAAAVALADAIVVVGAPRRLAVHLQIAMAYPYTVALLAAHCSATRCAAMRYVTATGVLG